MKPQNKKAVKPIDFTALKLFNLSNYIFFRFAQEIAHTQYNQNKFYFYFA